MEIAVVRELEDGGVRATTHPATAFTGCPTGDRRQRAGLLAISLRNAAFGILPVAQLNFPRNVQLGIANAVLEREWHSGPALPAYCVDGCKMR